jgi:thiosulfate dehydrogenase
MKGNILLTNKPFQKVSIVLMLVSGIWLTTLFFSCNENQTVAPKEKSNDKNMIAADSNWVAPDESTIPAGEAGDEIRYGKELIVHTSAYLGPKGKVASISNGLNCQNCHLAAGTKPYALNFSAVKSTYPQVRNRSGTLVSIAERVNGCFSRSLNGQPLDTASREMKAMIAYMEWIGNAVPIGVKPANAGTIKLKYLDRAADPEKGKIVFATCQVCHGKDGQGQLNGEGTEYIFPPLWGPHSYNDGAGLYRISNFAAFVKSNMPFGTTYEHPVLSDEQAWDIAAYVNSQPRPHKDQSKDYVLSGKKPIDSPYGPYKDTFSERQHKYGPYQPILLAQNKKTENK